MKKIVILGGLVLFFSLVVAQPSSAASLPAVIKGRIKDSIAGQPIADAVIKVHNIKGQAVVFGRSDGFGDYSISLKDAAPSGTYFVAASHKDYPRISYKRLIEKGKEYRVDFILRPPKTEERDDKPPRVVSMTPADGSIFYVGSPIRIAPTVTDMDGSPDEYFRYIIDGRRVSSYWESGGYLWDTKSAYAGSHEVIFWINDDSDSLSRRTAEICLIHKPPFPAD